MCTGSISSGNSWLVLALALQVLLVSVPIRAQTAEELLYGDWEALVELYSSLDGENWTDNSGWTPEFVPFPIEESYLAGWFGVTVNNGRVTQISLDGNNLTGSLPEEIAKLTAVTVFKLSNNTLTGSIPAEIGMMSELRELSLYTNALTGAIPSEIGGLDSLNGLRLSRNQLTGEIPSEIGNLTALNRTTSKPQPIDWRHPK